MAFNRSWQIFIISSDGIDKRHDIKGNENLYYLSFANRGSIQFTKRVTHIST